MAELKHPHNSLPASVTQRRRDVIRREMKLHWQRLSDDALLAEAARRDACLLMLHEKYGYTHHAAGEELDDLIRSLRPSHGTRSLRSTRSSKSTQRRHP